VAATIELRRMGIATGVNLEAVVRAADIIAAAFIARNVRKPTLPCLSARGILCTA